MARHPGTEHLARMLDPNPNLPDHLRRIAEKCAELRDEILAECGDGPELTTGLRKLLEAKDCFVRQIVTDQKG